MRAFFAGILLSMIAPLAGAQTLKPHTTAEAAFIAENGEASIEFNATLLDSLGITVGQLDRRGQATGTSANTAMRWALNGRYAFDAPGDYATRFHEASLKLLGGLQLRAEKRRVAVRDLSIEPNKANTLEFGLFDARGQLWFTATHAHHHVRGAKLELKNMDLRAGPAFDRWFAVSEFRGAVLGTLNIESPLIRRAAKSEIKSCAVPNWPNTPGAPDGGLWRADVLLENMNTLQGGGCTGGCDGLGGAGVGRVKFTPSASLRNSNNANTAEVPWYQMFSEISPPHNNDQHPYLLWNVYRLDPSGRFVQIARSGVKHAFYTVNTNCAQTCNSQGRILGRGCGDVYGTSNNDTASALGARSEIVPALGIWGRCGSTHDPACLGTRSSPPLGAFEVRALALEGELDPSVNVGSQFYFDGWYVVRDDINIFNTMGSQSFTPSYNASTWAATSLTPFVRGATIDRWVSPTNPGANAFSSLIVSADGQIKTAVRAIDLGQGRWRYHYAVMNFDFARATITGNAPNTRVTDNRGLVAVSFGKGADVTIENLAFFDGDGVASNDWSAAISATEIEFRRDTGNDLSWGSMYSFSFEALAAPTFGRVELVAARGTPQRLSHITLTPGGTEPALFASAFD